VREIEAANSAIYAFSNEFYEAAIFNTAFRIALASSYSEPD